MPNLFDRWQDDVDRFEEFLGDVMPLRMPRFFDRSSQRLRALQTPVVDVYEDGDNVIVKAEIPGVTKQDIEVSVTDSILTIRGEKERVEEINGDSYYRSERSYGSFSRTVPLPTEVRQDGAEASFSNGVLEVRLPKTEEAKKKGVTLKIK